jgi:hypothetical protein
VEGAFVGSTRTTITLPSGSHQVSVSNGGGHWQRSLMVNLGESFGFSAKPKWSGAKMDGRGLSTESDSTAAQRLS